MKWLIAAGLLLGGFGAAQAQPVNQPPYNALQCNKSVAYSSSAAGTTQLVALVANQQIYVCGWDFQVAAGAAIQFEYGTGSSCGTGTTTISPAFAPTGVFIDSSPFYRGLSAPASQALCLVQTGAFAVSGLVFYGQY